MNMSVLLIEIYDKSEDDKHNIERKATLMNALTKLNYDYSILAKCDSNGEDENYVFCIPIINQNRIKNACEICGVSPLLCTYIDKNNNVMSIDRNYEIHHTDLVVIPEDHRYKTARTVWREIGANETYYNAIQR